MNRFLPPGRQRLFCLTLIVTAYSVGLASNGIGTAAAQTWPFQDGTMILSEDDGGYSFSFPYVPFLGTHPVWTPALPQYYGQEPEKVVPLAGLGGFLQIGTVDSSGAFQPFNETTLKLLERSPYLLDAGLANGAGALTGISPIDVKGFELYFHNEAQTPTTLRFEIEGLPYKNVWATPGRKSRHDWGYNRWEAFEDRKVLLHTYSTPIDATRTACTALWFDRAWKGHSVPEPPKLSPAPAASIDVEVPAQGDLRFGFLHDDRVRDLFHAVDERRSIEQGLEKEKGRWNEWIDASLGKVEAKIRSASASITNATSPLGSYRKSFSDALARARALFLSNGGVLTRPMTLAEYPLDVRDQGIGMNHWVGMGLEFPFMERWRDLARYNPHSERSLSIEVIGGERIDRLFTGQTAVIATPDPNHPPSKRLMDILLGYAISGGKVMLVDGVFGFEQVDGWWKEEGFRDPADYAVQTLGIELDPASRRILDEEGLAEEVNTFCLGAPVYLDGDSDTVVETKTFLPGGGYMLIYPRSSKPGDGVVIEGGRIGETSFAPFTLSEDEILSASYDSQPARNEVGIPTGRSIRGEGFVAYRLPEGGTLECALSLSGKWKIAWSKEPLKTHHTLVKKAFQDWFLRELLTADISRLAHPVVYGATWGARIFDVTGTELSPILFRKIGRGSFAWIGLPRDYLLLGSDTGTDRQNSLRRDTTYDLLRIALALHDQERGGGQQAGLHPARGWSEGWSQSTRNGPPSDRALFAWTPTRLLGGGAGSQEYWSWAMDCFYQAQDRPERQGQRMNIGGLIVRDLGEGKESVDLYANACRYALFADMGARADRVGLGWWKNRVEKKAEAIADDLLAILDLGSATPVWGRAVKDGSAEEAIPIEAFLPEAAWTASEINGARFPGGEAARGRVIDQLLESASSSGDPRSRAALATLPGAKVEELLKGVFPGEAFDLAVALPAMHAICNRLASQGAQ